MPGVRTAAYVLGRTAVATRGQVMAATIQPPAAGPAVRWRIWAYGSQVKQEEFIGRELVLIDSYRATAGGLVMTSVSPPGRSWSRGRGEPVNPASGCARAASPGFLFSPGMQVPADFPRYIRTALACGAYRLAGHARIHGADTIGLRYTGTYQAAGGVVAESHGKPYTVPGSRGRVVRFHYTLYVDPVTYLPVRIAGMGPAGLTGDGFGHEDFRWLPPTKANRELLQVTIPAGYHH